MFVERTDQINARGQVMKTAIEVLAHEVRNSLQASRSASELAAVLLREVSGSIRSRQSQAKLNDVLEQMQSSVDSIDFSARIVTKVLKAVSLDEGNEKLIESPYFPYKVVERARRIVLPQAREKSINICLELIDLEDVYIVSDADKLQQVLVNLLSNAIKFTPTGGNITIRMYVSARDEEAKRIKLEFTVIDNGEGIKASARSNIFHSWFTTEPDNDVVMEEESKEGERERKRKQQGTGLGIPLSRGYLRLMGGDLELVESILGEGTTFKGYIFCNTVTPEEMEDRNKEDSPPLVDIFTDKLAQRCLRGKKILMADDEMTGRMLISRLIRQLGCLVDTVENGQAAVKMAQAKQYDAIILDQEMPEMQGTEAAQVLRDSGYTAPILLLTGNTNQATKDAAVVAGITDYLVKPVSIGVLGKALFKHLLIRVRREDKSNVARHSLFLGRRSYFRFGVSTAGAARAASGSTSRIIGSSSRREVATTVDGGGGGVGISNRVVATSPRIIDLSASHRLTSEVRGSSSSRAVATAGGAGRIHVLDDPRLLSEVLGSSSSEETATVGGSKEMTVMTNLCHLRDRENVFHDVNLLERTNRDESKKDENSDASEEPEDVLVKNKSPCCAIQ